MGRVALKVIQSKSLNSQVKFHLNNKIATTKAAG